MPTQAHAPAGGQTTAPLSATVDDLYLLIGRQHVEIQVLRAALALAQAREQVTVAQAREQVTVAQAAPAQDEKAAGDG